VGRGLGRSTLRASCKLAIIDRVAESGKGLASRPTTGPLKQVRILPRSNQRKGVISYRLLWFIRVKSNSAPVPAAPGQLKGGK